MKKLLVIITALVVLLIPSFAGAADTSYVINDYNRTITVNENNTYQVEDTMEVTFNGPVYGLRVDIPVVNKVSRVSNGKVYDSTYKLLVSDIHADQEFDTERDGDTLKVMIGDPDTYVTGEHSYQFGYLLDVGEDGIDAFDEFNYNLIAPSWAAPIEHFSFTINMPKEFDPSKVGFSTGAAETVGYNQSAVQYSVDGNTITGEIDQKIAPYEGFNIRIELPEGYFVGARSPYSSVLPCVLLGVIALALSLLLLGMSGKRRREVQTVELRAPEGMNPADVGYIVDGIVENKDAVSLLIYWADQGYIEIHQKTKSDLSFHKIKDLPKTANDYEVILFDKMFGAGDTISISSMQYEFAGTIATVKSRIKDKYDTDENRVFTKKSLMLQKLACVLAPLPLTFAFGWSQYMEEFDPFAAVLSAVFVWVFGWIIANMICTNLNKWKSEKLATKTGSLILGCVFLAIYCGVVALFSFDLFGIWIIAPVVCSGLMVFLTPLFRKRTEKGADWAGRILGLKHFIESVEADKLKMMVEDDPKYFYSILPYAYVLGVSDKWAKQFESIAVEPPNWYYGYNGSVFTTVWFASMMSHSMMMTQQNMMMTRGSGGSGMGGFGGGIGGGGGFSGGGSVGGGIGGGGGTW